MSTFEPVGDAKVILMFKGVYIETSLHQLGTQLFAKIRTGYIRLLSGQLTSHSNIRWEKISVAKTVMTPFGPRLATAEDLEPVEPVKQAKKPARKTPVKARKPTLDKSGRQLSA